MTQSTNLLGWSGACLANRVSGLRDLRILRVGDLVKLGEAAAG